MSRLWILICLIVIGITVSGRASTNDFEQGLAAAKAGNFPEAATAFTAANRSAFSTGGLLNLGLAEWQSGHAGAAILAWEQARWLDPFDERVATNLRFARQVAQVDAPDWRWFEAISLWLPPNDWVWLAGASLWLAVGALVLPRVFRWKKSGAQQTLAALGLGVFLCANTANIGVVSRTEIGFVLKRGAPLLLTPTHAGEVVSTMNAGEAGRVLRRRGDFFYIRTTMTAGWVERKNFGLINE